MLSAILALLSGCTGANHPLLDPVPGVVDGKVLDINNAPVSQANVRLERGGKGFNGVTSDSSGNYSINAVDPGLYDLVAEKEDDSGVKYSARRRFLSIDEATRIQREIQIRPVGRITGYANLEGHNTHAGITVSLIGTGKITATNAEGFFEFKDLAYTYRDEATNSLYLYDVVLTYAGFANITIQDISVEAGGLTHLSTETLQNLDPVGEADVIGSVRLQARDGALGASIKILGTAIEPFQILSDSPDQRGFKFNKVPVGSYMLEISHPDYYPMQYQFTIEAGQSEISIPEQELTNVWHFPGDKRAIEMTISPGGHQIAYAKYSPGNVVEHREIYIMDIAGAAYNSRISSRARVAEDRGMSWSSDGRQLIYVEENQNSIASKKYRLNVISSSGGSITRFEGYQRDVAQPAFAAMGYRFVYHSNDNNVAAIFGADLVQRASGWKIENQFEVISEENDQPGIKNLFSSIELGVSDTVLYSKDGYGGFTIPLEAVGDTSLKFPIANMGPESHSVTFSPYNDHVAYAKSDVAESGIYLANIDGSNPQRISIHKGRSLEFAPDGKHLYFIDHSTGKERHLARMIIPGDWASENR